MMVRILDKGSATVGYSLHEFTSPLKRFFVSDILRLTLSPCSPLSAPSLKKMGSNERIFKDMLYPIVLKLPTVL
jgi:hypothetical protein